VIEFVPVLVVVRPSMMPGQAGNVFIIVMELIGL